MKAVPLTLAALALAMSAVPARAAAPLLLDERALATRLAEHVASQYDTARHAWVAKDGTPLDGAADLALRLARTGTGAAGDAWRVRGLAMVDWTWTLQDTLTGGFFGRARDTAKGNTAFEKRTDVNARRLEALVDAWQLTGATRARARAARVVDFMERVLADGRGGFVAAQVGDRDLVPADNGLAIHAWLRWAAATNDLRARGFALRSIDRVFATCTDTSFGVVRRGSFGELLKPPQLIDQVEMGRACLLAAHLAGRAADLASARALADRMLRWYEDHEQGGFLTQAYPDKRGKLRRAPRESWENARAALFLAELASVAGEDAYRTAARRTIAAFARTLARPVPESADWALAARAVTVAELPERPEWPDAAQGRGPEAGGKRQGEAVSAPATLNALTVDFEDWFQGLEIPLERWDAFEDRLAASTRRLLDLLAAHRRVPPSSCSATSPSATPSWCARSSRRARAGTHGRSHTLVYD